MVGDLYSPSYLSVIGFLLQGSIRVVVPPTSLLHPGRVTNVGPRLLTRREIPAYLAASLIYLEVIPLSATPGRAGLQLQFCLSQNVDQAIHTYVFRFQSVALDFDVKISLSYHCKSLRYFDHSC